MKRLSKNLLKLTTFKGQTTEPEKSTKKNERESSDMSLTCFSSSHCGSSMTLDGDGFSDNDSISSIDSTKQSFRDAPSSATVNVLLSQLKALDEETINDVWDSVNKEKTLKLIEESIARLTSINLYLRKRLHHNGRVVRLHVAASNQAASVQTVKKVLALESELEKTINAINLLGMLVLEARRRKADGTSRFNFRQRFQMIISESVPLMEVVSSELAEEAAARVVAL